MALMPQMVAVLAEDGLDAGEKLVWDENREMFDLLPFGMTATTGPPWCEPAKGKDTSEVRVTASTGASKGVKDARFDLIPSGPLRGLG